MNHALHQTASHSYECANQPTCLLAAYGNPNNPSSYFLMCPNLLWCMFRLWAFRYVCPVIGCNPHAAPPERVPVWGVRARSQRLVVPRRLHISTVGKTLKHNCQAAEARLDHDSARLARYRSLGPTGLMHTYQGPLTAACCASTARCSGSSQATKRMPQNSSRLASTWHTWGWLAVAQTCGAVV